VACELNVHGRVMLAVWGRPEMDDIVACRAAVSSLHKQCGPVVFISRVPSNEAAPDDQVRDAITELLGEFMSDLASFHAVLEGRGFFAAAKRTVLATVFLMTGKRLKYHVHSTLDQVLESVSPSDRNEVAAALMNFRNRGLIRPSVPGPAALGTS
jgi:hypothetical protein